MQPSVIHLYHTRGGRADSHRLLTEAAQAYCTDTARPLPPITLTHAPGGKPSFLHAPELHFSISHSGERWICAFSDTPVGIDLQERKPAREQALARRFFHPDEAAYLDAHPDAFFALWTAKESYVKLTGNGIAAEFSRVSVIRDGDFAPPPPAAALVHIPFAEGYALCLCGSTDRICLHELHGVSR